MRIDKMEYPLASVSRCPDCGKLRYPSRKLAKVAARRIQHSKDKLSVYRCGDFWHHTSQDAKLRAIYREQDYYRGLLEENERQGRDPREDPLFRQAGRDPVVADLPDP